MDWLRFGGAKNRKRGPEISGPRRSGRNFKDGDIMQNQRAAVKADADWLPWCVTGSHNPMSSHVARLEAEIASLESEFRSKLIAALRDCASGRWGLFGQNDRVLKLHSREVEELLELGASIEELRRKAGISEPFELYESFQSKRGWKGENAVGESRLAKGVAQRLGV